MTAALPTGVWLITNRAVTSRCDLGRSLQFIEIRFLCLVCHLMSDVAICIVLQTVHCCYYCEWWKGVHGLNNVNCYLYQ